MASTAARAESLSFPEARERVLAAARPLPPETIAAGEARGRALRKRVIAPHPLPPFRNSSMDGFALHAADGTPLALTDSRQAAVGHAMGDELEIASLH